MSIHIHVMGEYGDQGLYDVAKIRLHLPLEALAKKENFSVTYGPHWKGHESCDLFIVERLWRLHMSSEELFKFLFFIQSQNKRLIYEIDDDLLDLSSITVEQKNRVRLLAQYANCVTVSTTYLQERMSRFNQNIFIIPNYLSLKVIQDMEINEKRNQKVTIGYMGTFSHQADFQMVKLPLLQLLTKFPKKVRFEFLGAVGDIGVLSKFENVYVHTLTGHSNYEGFWSWIKKDIQWDIGIAPLKENEFTICKSDIKFLDYANMGCCGIFSNHSAYRDTVKNGINGVLVDNTVDAWYAQLEKLVNEDSLRIRMAKNARRYLLECRILENNIQNWKNAIHFVLRNHTMQS